VAAGLDVASIAWLAWDPTFNLLLVAALFSFPWPLAASIALMRMGRPAPRSHRGPTAD
jgi:hypothetical protein